MKALRKMEPYHTLRAALELAYLGSETDMLESLAHYFDMKDIPPSPALVQKLYEVYEENGLKRKITEDVKVALNKESSLSEREKFANQAIADLTTYVKLLH